MFWSNKRKAERRSQRRLGLLASLSFLFFLPLTFLLVSADEVMHSVTIVDPNAREEEVVEDVVTELEERVEDKVVAEEKSLVIEGRHQLNSKGAVQVRGVRVRLGT